MLHECQDYIFFRFTTLFQFQVPGNFHVARHSADKQPDSYDFAHEIHRLSFGSVSSKEIGSFNSEDIRAGVEVKKTKQDTKTKAASKEAKQRHQMPPLKTSKSRHHVPVESVKGM